MLKGGGEGYILEYTPGRCSFPDIEEKRRP